MVKENVMRALKAAGLDTDGSFSRDEIEVIAVTLLRERWRDVHECTELDGLAEQVVAGETDPYAAADRLLEAYAE